MKTLRDLLLKLLAVVLLSSTLGCGALMTYEVSGKEYDKPPGKNDVTPKPFEDDEFLVEMANRYGLMALFAEIVYRSELHEDVRDDQGCKYLVQGQNGDAQYGMPKIADSTEGWERWIPNGVGAPPCRNDKNGLYYETYVYRDSNNIIQEAVIAFRGTENRKGQAASDWGTNLSAAFGIEPAQYRTARIHLPDLIARLTDEGGPQIKIYTVGHSLGGGLAQQAGYLSSKIKEAFTFNTTPVTNWTHLRHKGLVEQGYPIIHRIYHGGEGLEVPRFVATSATEARYGRHDVGVQFGPRKFAKGHAMKILACNFGWILSKKMLNGSHNYPKAYIDLRVLKEATGAQSIPEMSNMPRRVCDDDLPGRGHSE